MAISANQWWASFCSDLHNFRVYRLAISWPISGSPLRFGKFFAKFLRASELIKISRKLLNYSFWWISPHSKGDGLQGGQNGKCWKCVPVFCPPAKRPGRRVRACCANLSLDRTERKKKGSNLAKSWQKKRILASLLDWKRKSAFMVLLVSETNFGSIFRHTWGKVKIGKVSALRQVQFSNRNLQLHIFLQQVQTTWRNETKRRLGRKKKVRHHYALNK